MNNSIKSSEWKMHGTVGLILIAVFWYLNWGLDGLRTHWGFFPLWVGYSLTVDALTFYLKHDSLFVRNRKSYLMLFVISIPCWWLFELLNLRTQNWFYIGREHFSDIEFFILASLSFSTVMPAMFGTAELVSSLKLFKKLKASGEKLPGKSTVRIVFLTGVLILLLIIIFPQYLYFLIWAAVYLIIDPINAWLNNKSLLGYFANKDFRPLISLGAGALICGFFWEMWNYYSYPKWTYDVPMVNFAHIFEMPALGYIGYVPFALELFALHQIISGFLRKKDNHYLRITAE